MLHTSEVVNEIPVHPYVFGAIALVLFMVLLVITLLFGKGRQHS